VRVPAVGPGKPGVTSKLQKGDAMKKAKSPAKKPAADKPNTVTVKAVKPAKMAHRPKPQ
jgi:hypothetical protein